MKNVAQSRNSKPRVTGNRDIDNTLLGNEIYHAFASQPDAFMKFIEKLYLLHMGCENIDQQSGFTPTEVAQRLEAYSPAADIAAAAAGRDEAPFRAAFKHYAHWADTALTSVYGYVDLVANAFEAGE